MSTAPAKSSNRIYLALTVGIAAISLAAIFIRLAEHAGMPALVIAAGRLSLSALVLTPFALCQRWGEIRQLQRRDLLLVAAAGVFLAIHFATWIASLDYTSVLISVVLVTTNPLWVALLEVLFLKARLTRLLLAGLGIALAGGALIGLAGGSPASEKNPGLGIVLALTGGVAFAFYLIIGRSVRKKMSLLPYIWLVYSCAGIVLLSAIAVTGVPLAGYSPTGYLWVALVALVPQSIGHSSMNYALKYLSATYVSLATQMEPLGSAIVAFAVFQETPQPLQFLGSLAILVGVIMATLGQRQREKIEAEIQVEAT